MMKITDGPNGPKRSWASTVNQFAATHPSLLSIVAKYGCSVCQLPLLYQELVRCVIRENLLGH